MKKKKITVWFALKLLSSYKVFTLQNYTEEVLNNWHEILKQKDRVNVGET